jgi:leader peptidase (prepilin peptidase)/N-methyltransferase
MIAIDPVFAPFFAFLFGACIGSFLNVCIARWPREQSVVRPRSRCPKCGHQLAWFENIPLASWVALRARCRCCTESISAMYPAIELLVALGWLGAVLVYGPSFTAVRVAVFGTVLLGVAILAFFLGQSSLFAGPYEALIGACAGAGMIAIVGWLGEVALKREAMGLGDVTLMAFIGGALGPQRAIMTVFVASALGAVTFLGVVYPITWLRRTHTRDQTELALGGAPFAAPLVPFGVFLAPAAMLTLLWGETWLGWLLGS